MTKKRGQPISWKPKEKRGVKVKKPIPWKNILISFVAKIRLTIGILVMLLLIASPYIVWQYLERTPVFTIDRIVVRAKTKYLSPEDVQRLTRSAFKQNFISFDVSHYRDQISHFPWIKSVQVIRHWFSELEVVLEERVPVASVNKQFLVEENGFLFEPSGVPVEGLVDLMVDKESLPKVLAQKDNIISMLEKVGIKLEAISLDYRGSWSLFFNDGVEVILGTIDIQDRLKTFVNHYRESIESKIDNIISIDLRYNQGYAIKWKK